MTYRRLTVSAATTVGISMAAIWAPGCTAEVIEPTPPATGGTTTTAGTGGTGGSGVAGTGGAKGGSAGSGTGGSTAGTGGSAAGTGGATAGSSGAGPAGAGGGAGTAAGASSGGAGAGGSPAGGGPAGSSGSGGAAAGMAGTGSGTGGETGAGSGGTGKGGTGGTGSGTEDDIDSGQNTMGWIGCSMANNVAEGYARIGGTRMWGGYGNGGAVVQSWTSNTSGNWNGFDQQVSRNGMPKAVWIMICVFSSGATMNEIKQMVANAKTHAPGAFLYITGQPLYEEGHVCQLAGDGMPETTDMQAQMAAADDPELHYAGALGPLNAGEYSSDSCHTTSSGGDKIGRQVKEIWGQPG